MQLKISCLAFDIHISKLAIIEWHSTKASKTYNCLVFSINQNINSLKNYFLEGKTILGNKCVLKNLTNCFLQIVKGDGFWQLKESSLSKIVFATHHLS